MNGQQVSMVGSRYLLDRPPFFSEECPDLYVPVTTRPFRKARVVWLNAAYWTAQGFPVQEEDARSEVTRWLLDSFAVAVPDPNDPEEMFLEGERLLHADRYGAGNGARHGGSGRSASRGSLNAKGIGRTPLCGIGADWYHSHGCLWLEEAIREAIFSCLAWREFPYGANPVVAVIDTGERLRWSEGDLGAERAVLVRPSPLRIAHLERSIYFGSAGHPLSDQYLDARRVDQVFDAVFGDAAKGPDHLTAEVQRICDRLGRQIGYGRAHRLFHGDYLSSNLCLSGQLLDFGAFRAVPDWQPRKWEENAIAFGQETGNLVPTIGSLLHLCRKRGAGILLNRRQLIERLEQAAASSFASEMALIAGENGAASTQICDLLCSHFDYEQRVPSIPLDDRRPNHWIYSGLTGMSGATSHPEAHSVGRAIRSILIGKEDGGRTNALNKATFMRLERWARPRRLGHREVLQSIINRTLRERNCREAGRERESGSLSDAINKLGGLLRRDFRLPSETAVLRRVMPVGDALVQIWSDVVSGKPIVRLEVPGNAHEAWIMGRRIETARLEKPFERREWGLVLEPDRFSISGHELELTIGGRTKSIAIGGAQFGSLRETG